MFSPTVGDIFPGKNIPGGKWCFRYNCVVARHEVSCNTLYYIDKKYKGLSERKRIEGICAKKLLPKTYQFRNITFGFRLPHVHRCQSPASQYTVSLVKARQYTDIIVVLHFARCNEYTQAMWYFRCYNMLEYIHKKVTRIVFMGYV